jgi:hypothetical protein
LGMRRMHHQEYFDRLESGKRAQTIKLVLKKEEFFNFGIEVILNDIGFWLKYKRTDPI